VGGDGPKDPLKVLEGVPSGMHSVARIRGRHANFHILRRSSGASFGKHVKVLGKRSYSARTATNPSMPKTESREYLYLRSSGKA
jgi:hypothetical protein